MTEMEWTQLGKKLGLKTRPEQKGKSLQLRYFRNLGLSCLQVSGFLFFFFQFSPHNAPSYTTLCYEIFPVKPFSSVDAWSFTIPTIVYVVRDSYVSLTSLSRVSNLVAGLGNTLNLISQNYHISLIDKSKLKNTCVTSNYFIKFPALHKNYQQIKIKPSQQNILLNNYSNLLEIKPKIHDISTIITTFMTSPHLTDRLHLSPFYNRILIDLGDLNDPMTPSEIEEGDHLLIPNKNPAKNKFQVYTMYKRVDKKIRPVSTNFPEGCHIRRSIPEDPLITLTPLPFNPPEFEPTKKITLDQMKILNVNATGFLLPEEEKLFKHIMVLDEDTIAFEDAERGTLKESYFDPYIFPTLPHKPWEYKNIPIPPGILDKVVALLKLMIAAGVYEQSQSSYRSRWFVVLKKNGKLRIVHDLQPLNKVSVRDAGTLPILDDFVDGFAG